MGEKTASQPEPVVRLTLPQEILLLLFFLLPAGFAFFAIMLELSLPGKAGGAAVLIVALTANRLGRMFSAAVSVFPVFKKYDVPIAGLAQSAGLLMLYAAWMTEAGWMLVCGALFLGIAMAAVNVFFRTLLTGGVSSLSTAQYSIMFYALWGAGIAAAGFSWNYQVQKAAIPLMIAFSAAGTIMAQVIFRRISASGEELCGLPHWSEAGVYARIFSLSVPAAIAACVAILFNAALVPVLTDRFGFSVAGTGMAAFFIVIGNMLALFWRPEFPSGVLRRFSFFILANMMLVVALFLLRDSKAAALLLIVSIGWTSVLSLDSQMEFIKAGAGRDYHRLIHALSEILSVSAGLLFALINVRGVPVIAQFAAIGLILLFWAALESRARAVRTEL